jgi:hypothetical protein
MLGLLHAVVGAMRSTNTLGYWILQWARAKGFTLYHSWWLKKHEFDVALRRNEHGGDHIGNCNYSIVAIGWIVQVLHGA